MAVLRFLNIDAVITHLYPKGLPVNAQELSRLVDLVVKVAQGFDDMFFFHIDQGHPAGHRIQNRGLAMIVLTVIEYIGKVDDLMVAEYTEAFYGILQLPDIARPAISDQGFFGFF